MIATSLHSVHLRLAAHRSDIRYATLGICCPTLQNRASRTRCLPDGRFLVVCKRVFLRPGAVSLLAC